MRKLFILILIYICFGINAYAIDTSADCACLINADTGEVLYSHNSEKIHSMASTTKIMTAIIALEKSNFEELVTVSKTAQNQEGSSVYLREGEQVKMADLLYGMMLNSGNDAACAIAEHISGNSDDFAILMTEKAKEIGAKNTSFKNANGLDADGHYSTALDMAKITAYALKNREFSKIVSEKTASINTSGSITYLKNHNKLLWNYDGCIGVKTGYTKRTGRCLVSAATRNGITLIAVTLDDPDDWKDHTALLNFGFENTTVKTLIKKGDIVKSFKTKNAKFNAVAAENLNITASNSQISDAKIVIHTIKHANSNIAKNEKIGYIECILNGNVVATSDLLCDTEVIVKNKVKNNSFRIYLFNIIRKLLI